MKNDKLMGKIILWIAYIGVLIGIAYLITEGFYMAGFWKWMLS